MIHNDLNEIYMSQLYVPRNHYISISAVIEPPSERGGGGSAMIDPLKILTGPHLRRIVPFWKIFREFQSLV